MKKKIMKKKINKRGLPAVVIYEFVSGAGHGFSLAVHEVFLILLKFGSSQRHRA